jgi:hypothetical protein
VAGPFVLRHASTNAPKHPITRLDVLAAAGSDGAVPAGDGPAGAGDGSASGGPGKSTSLSSLFADGVVSPEVIAAATAEKRIFNLPPRGTLVATVEFDPAVGQSLRETAAALFFSKGTSVPPGALSHTAALSDAGRSSRGVLLPGASGAARTSGGGDGRVVEGAMAASVTRLKGEHVGALVVTYANGTRQEVSLHAEVLRPTVVATPSAVSCGVALVTRESMGACVLTNPTVVDAGWSLRHIPAASPPPSVGHDLDWGKLGLPSTGAWNPATDTVPPLDDPSVFTWSTTGGTLRGPTVPGDVAAGATLRGTSDTPQPLPLTVAFRPREARVYRCLFRIAVAQGAPTEVVVVGRGTLDEADAGRAAAAVAAGGAGGGLQAGARRG